MSFRPGRSLVPAADSAPAGFTIRVVIIDGAPWFVAADVCRALGFDDLERGTTHHLRTLPADQRRAHTLIQKRGIRGNPSVTLISESGLYRLVLRSDKPEARAFQDWVTREVLPAIRKDGADLPACASHDLSCRPAQGFLRRALLQHSTGPPAEPHRRPLRSGHGGALVAFPFRRCPTPAHCRRTRCTAA